jgi:hypothetical protein
MRFTREIKLSLAALLAAGCATHPVPTDELGASESAIVAALDAGAAEHAAPELESAQEKVNLGRRWIAAKDYEPATWLIEQARVDAELARMKATSARARAAAALGGKP